MSTLEKPHILILGLGRSGLAAVDLALLQGNDVTVLDTNFTDGLEERANRLERRGASIRLDWNSETWDEAVPVDLAIISPGIGDDTLLGRLAASLPCPVISELEFGFRACSCPIIAVTGTNGKTTTVELLVHILKGAGKRVIGAGNLGLPLSEAARKSAGLDFIVAEVSSFQLERTDHFAPLAAAFLNLSSDHMDRYEDIAAYRDAKLNLFRHPIKANRVVVHHNLASDPAVRERLPNGGVGIVTFSAHAEQQDATYFLSANDEISTNVGGGKTPLLSTGKLRLSGAHNAENIMAALALCEAVGVAPSDAAPHVASYVPSAHRFELVTVHNGVTYIDDSKATNPDALIKALVTCAKKSVRRNGKIILIAGGRDKKMDFSPVLPYLGDNVKEIYLIGETKDMLTALWGDTVPCRALQSLAACVANAMEFAESGDAVLLAPGCASQDMFTDYIERGNIFTLEVRRRAGE